MLGKLIKQEWKAVWKILGGINLFMPCLTLIGSIGFFIFTTVHVNEFIGSMLISTFGMAYGLTIFATTVGIMIYIGVRYYRSMYGSEGYLTHTLPATPLQLIVSKLIVSVIWYWITLFVMLASIIILVISASAASGYPIDLLNILYELRELEYSMRREGISLVGTIVTYTGMYLLGNFFGIIMLYASAALGQLFDRYRIISSVGIYFGFTMILQVLSFAAMIPIIVMTNEVENPLTIFGAIIIIGYVGIGLATAGLFLLTYFLTKKKLNLE